MEIGVGLDARLGMSWTDETDLSSGSRGTRLHERLDAGGQRAGLVPSVCPTVDGQPGRRAPRVSGRASGYRLSSTGRPVSFAMAGGTVSEITGGRFVMGIGTGGAYRPASRRAVGLGRMSALALMRDYLKVIRGLLAGNLVDYEGETVTLRNMRLGISPPPRTPVYLGALGPKMLELSGELADGASLNWCTPEQVAWSRERIDAGAARAGRQPSEIRMAEYIRICVDDDVAAARIALAKAAAGYALGGSVPTERERQFGYRAHFERMGFTEELAELDSMRIEGAGPDDVAEAFPEHLLRAVSYFGTGQRRGRGVQAARPGTRYGHRPSGGFEAWSRVGQGSHAGLRTRDGRSGLTRGLVFRQAQIYGYLRHYHGTNVSVERQRPGAVVAWSTSGAGPQAEPKVTPAGHSHLWT